MAKGKSRWQLADENFRRQFDHFLAESGLKRKDVENELGISPPTLKRYYDSPSTMTRYRERQLVQLFERYGVRYDLTLGEGARA
jgi:hypothetical protein